ncbi:META domain-containing protein [uncultured Piscinibacter sp.]|uniref:META domain-containing protein n=1 Tax=uncultured Piscinibacter sp. TaxID=1131835 RepID=UPI002610EB43|nr:META domain-containing protein [uncultured Piscinibacter sp.]
MALALVSMLMAGCTSPGPAGPASGSGGSQLAGTRWVLQALGGDAASGAPAVTLNFEADGRFGGTDGCNAYQGSYTAGTGAFRVGGSIAGTLMACPEAIEARAHAYRESLQRAARFTLEGARLKLHDGTGSTLAQFVPAMHSPVGASWEVIAYNNGRQGVVSVITGTKITARFGNDGRVTGSAGCNAYFADFQLDGETLTVGPTGATRRLCAEPQGLMQQESLYLAALQSAARFRLDGDRLELRTAHGALALSLTRSLGER